MAITNGYCTLNEIRERLHDRHTYTASTLSFSGTTITDSAYGLKRFQDGDLLQVSGSTSNNGFHTVATDGGDTAHTITVSASLTTESAGQSVTITNMSDQVDDAQLESVVEAVSRWIDEETNRRFYATSETRYFTALVATRVRVDDLLSITTFKTDLDGDRTYETTWATTDYDLSPPNASLDGRPYTHATLAPNGRYSFPTHAKGIEIEGSFGYATTAPKPVKEACLLASVRLAMRPDVPFGIQGSGDMGHIRAILSKDPDVMNLITPYRRRQRVGRA